MSVLVKIWSLLYWLQVRSKWKMKAENNMSYFLRFITDYSEVPHKISEHRYRTRTGKWPRKHCSDIRLAQFLYRLASIHWELDSQIWCVVRLGRTGHTWKYFFGTVISFTWANDALIIAKCLRRKIHLSRENVSLPLSSSVPNLNVQPLRSRWGGGCKPQIRVQVGPACRYRADPCTCAPAGVRFYFLSSLSVWLLP